MAVTAMPHPLRPNQLGRGAFPRRRRRLCRGSS